MTDRLWAEITVEIDPSGVEAASAALVALGADGVVILGTPAMESAEEWAAPPKAEPAGARAYFPVDDRLGERLQLLCSRMEEAAGELRIHPGRVSLRRLAEADWAEAWKAYYQPVHIDALTIVPSWEAYSPSPGETVVRLDPGMAFGAGTHPTTRQSLLLLQKCLRPGQRLLDLGTGCGVLAIAAARLGAGAVLARDIDPVAVEAAGDNVSKNGVGTCVTVELGDLAHGVRERFDLVLANLVAPLLLTLLPSLPDVLFPGGTAILAGIIMDRTGEIESAAAAAGFEIEERMQDGEWVALALSLH